MNSANDVRDLLTAYALTLDADDIDGCLALFTQDGEFCLYGKTLSGHAMIGKMLRRAPRGLHLTGAATVTVRGTTASARSQVLFVDSTTHDLRPALYDDEFVIIDGRWRFRSRRCQFITAAGLSDTPEGEVAPDGGQIEGKGKH